MRVLCRHRAKTDRVCVVLQVGSVELQSRIHCGAEPEFPAAVIDGVQRALVIRAVQ